MPSQLSNIQPQFGPSPLFSSTSALFPMQWGGGYAFPSQIAPLASRLMLPHFRNLQILKYFLHSTPWHPHETKYRAGILTVNGKRRTANLFFCGTH